MRFVRCWILILTFEWLYVLVIRLVLEKEFVGIKIGLRVISAKDN